MLDRVTSIALVRLRTGLGDLLCTWPAVRALRARFPAARIVLITYPEMAPVVERMAPYVDALVPFPGDPGIPERPPRPEAERERWYAALEPVDVALQAYGARTAANRVAARVPARIHGGFFVPGEWEPGRGPYLAYPQDVHEVDRHLALARLLGAPARGRHLEFPVTPEDEAEADAVLRDAGLRGRRFAVVHPGATSPSRRWPAERFAAVGDDLARRGLAVALTGVQGEERLTGAVAASMRARAVDLCGRTSLGGYAALLRQATVLAASDTGSAHLAAALRVPSVVAFLSGDPVRWAHPAPRHRVARVDVGCNPCPNLTCPIDHRCALRLEPRAFVRQVDAALAAS